MERISEHISWYEATSSNTAKRLGIENYPNEFELLNMEEIALKVFEPLRMHFNVPIMVSSFYRSPELNDAIKGSNTSQHMAQNGAAMDLDADAYGGVTNLEIFDYILDNLEFDQLILEDIKDNKAGWVHVSYNRYNNRNETLLMYKENGKRKYEHYSKERLGLLLKNM